MSRRNLYSFGQEWSDMLSEKDRFNFEHRLLRFTNVIQGNVDVELEDLERFIRDITIWYDDFEQLRDENTRRFRDPSLLSCFKRIKNAKGQLYLMKIEKQKELKRLKEEELKNRTSPFYTHEQMKDVVSLFTKIKNVTSGQSDENRKDANTKREAHNFQPINEEERKAYERAMSVMSKSQNQLEGQSDDRNEASVGLSIESGNRIKKDSELSFEDLLGPIAKGVGLPPADDRNKFYNEDGFAVLTKEERDKISGPALPSLDEDLKQGI